MGNGRIIYNGINLDLDKGFDSFRINPAQRSIPTYADSGVREDYNFYNMEQMEATLENLSPQMMAEIDKFYEYARDGSTFSFERDRELGGYWGFENSLKNNDGTDAATFTRTHVANADSYIDPDGTIPLSDDFYTDAEIIADSTIVKTFPTGKIQYAGAADTPRYPAGKYGSGVLLEGSSTNQLTYSEEFDNAAWTKNNITVSANTTETLDPFGTNTADKLTVTNATNSISYSTSVASASGVDCAFAIWIKGAGSSIDATLSITATGASPTGSKTQGITILPYWQRFWINFENGVDDTPNAACTYNVIVQNITNSAIVYVSAGHCATGADILYPTSYIQAVASTVTRNGELLRYATANVMNQYKGTVAFWFKPHWDAADQQGTVLFNSGTDGTNRHISYYITAAGSHELRLYNAGGGTTQVIPAASFAAFEWTHVVIVYDYLLEDGTKNLELYIDGASVGSAGTSQTYADALGTNFGLGCWTYTTGGIANGVFDDLLITKDAKDASWVNRIYNLGRGIGERKNRWSSVKLVDKNNHPIWRQGDRYNATLLFEEVKT